MNQFTSLGMCAGAGGQARGLAIKALSAKRLVQVA
jgi:hypothetical protein